MFIDFDDAQAPVIVFIQDALDARGFPCAGVAEKQAVVGPASREKGLCILPELLLLALIAAAAVCTYTFFASLLASSLKPSEPNTTPPTNTAMFFTAFIQNIPF
jgi:hypothetical protein